MDHPLLLRLTNDFLLKRAAQDTSFSEDLQANAELFKQYEESRRGPVAIQESPEKFFLRRSQ